MNIAISGTRYVVDQDLVEIKNTLRGFIEEFKPQKIFFGGAKGVDTIALIISAAILVDMYKKHKAYVKKVELIVVFPDRRECASPEAIERSDEFATSIVELKNKITQSNGYKSYQIRNEYMVNNSDMLLAFPAKSRKTGGTWNAINYAQLEGKEVVITELKG